MAEGSTPWPAAAKGKDKTQPSTNQNAFAVMNDPLRSLYLCPVSGRDDEGICTTHSADARAVIYLRGIEVKCVREGRSEMSSRPVRWFLGCAVLLSSSSRIALAQNTAGKP